MRAVTAFSSNSLTPITLIPSGAHFSALLTVETIIAKPALLGLRWIFVGKRPYKIMGPTFHDFESSGIRLDSEAKIDYTVALQKC